MNYREFVRGITTAYEHRGGIKTLRLSNADAAWFTQIQAECSTIIATAGSSDVGMKSHVTNWTRPTGQIRQFSLFNTSGDSADTKGDYGYLGDARKKRLVFPQMVGLSRFAKLFMPNLRNLRLNGMGTSAALSAHEEKSISATKWGPQHIVRFHLPIFTNPDAVIYLDDEAFHFQEGALYFFNHGCVHAAANRGTETRYHLVFDAFLCPELFAKIFTGSLTQHGDPFHFPDFVREDGSVISGPIDYGRHAPRFLDYYKKNYPSVFGTSRAG